MEAFGPVHEAAAGDNAEVTHCDAEQYHLLREGSVAAVPGEPADPPRRISEPGFLKGAGDSDVGVGQTTRD